VRRRRALALGTAALAGILWGTGCGGERVTECDALRATVAQVARCPRIEPTQRRQLELAVRSLEDALDRLEKVGPDRAPAQVLEDARRTCVKQDGDLRQMYEKVAPECLR